MTAAKQALPYRRPIIRPDATPPPTATMPIDPDHPPAPAPPPPDDAPAVDASPTGPVTGDGRHAPARGPGVLAWAFRAAVVLVLLAVGVGGVIYLYATAPRPAVVDPEANALAVPVFEAQPVAVTRQWRGYGTAAPVNSADVPARVSATVEKIADAAEPGTRVDAGQPLVWLDDSDFVQQVTIAEQRLAEVDAALAQLDIEAASLQERMELEEEDVDLAQAELDRLRELEAGGVANQQDLDDGRRALNAARRSRLATREVLDSLPARRRSLQAQRASLQASIEIARLNQQRSTIKSPLAGVIQSVDVEVGESLAAGQRVARVVAPTPVEVPLKLPASARSTLNVGDPVTLRPTAGDAEISWSTTVTRIAPEEDAATRTVTVYAVLTANDAAPGSNAPAPPAPGTFLEAVVTSGQQVERLVVPRRAIRGGRVQVVRDGVAVSVPIETAYVLAQRFPELGLPDDQWAVLDEDPEGLNPGDLVIVNAGSLIPDGQRVDPVLPEGEP